MHDRYVGTFEWRLLYPSARASSLEFFHSNHRPILLELGDAQPQVRYRCDRFQFEPLWATETDCYETVERGWDTMNETISITTHINNCKNPQLMIGLVIGFANFLNKSDVKERD